MGNTCGQCGSTNIFGGSWVPDKCRDCGAIECIDEWYYENDNTKELHTGPDRPATDEEVLP